jgi:hypothetical protein
MHRVRASAVLLDPASPYTGEEEIGSGAGGGNPGTTAGTYTITVNGTSGSLTATGAITLTVQ